MKLTCSRLYIDNSDYPPLCKDGDVFTTKADGRVKRLELRNESIDINPFFLGFVESRGTSWLTSCLPTPRGCWKPGLYQMRTTRNSTQNPSTAVPPVASNDCRLVSTILWSIDRENAISGSFEAVKFRKYWVQVWWYFDLHRKLQKFVPSIMVPCKLCINQLSNHLNFKFSLPSMQSLQEK